MRESEFSQGYVKLYLGDAPGGLVVQHLPGVWDVVGSIPGWVIPKTLKMVLDTSLLSVWHLKDRSRTYGRFFP